MTSRTLKSSPADYAWIAEQNPELSFMKWWQVSASAGQIVAEDIFGRVDPKIHDQEEGGGDLRLVIHVDGYTDGEGEGLFFNLFDLLSDSLVFDNKLVVSKLREYADRIEAESQP